VITCQFILFLSALENSLSEETEVAIND